MKNGKELKSKAKAAGVKSIFGVGDKVIMTSFGRGNEAIIEKHIENNDVIQIPEKEAYTATLSGKKISVKGNRIINLKNQTPYYPDALPDLPRSLNDDIKDDLIGAKDLLEMEFFGETFKDNIHIQVIYNILDIEKIIAVYINNIVYALNNLDRKNNTGYDNNDFIGTGLIGLRNSFDKFESFAKLEHTTNNQKKIDTYSFFKRLYNSNRVYYFSGAFIDKKLVKREEKDFYSILALINEIRQISTHHGASLGKAGLYNLDYNWDNKSKGLDGKDSIYVLDLLYREKRDELIDDYDENGNSFKTNSSKNYRILFDVLNATGEDEKIKIIKDYYRFALLKDYKNLGFSVKKLREAIINEFLPQIKGKEYDTIRSKLYGLLDFVLVFTYLNNSDCIDEFVGRLRITNEEEKDSIYVEEAKRVYQRIKDQIKKLLEKMEGIRHCGDYSLTKEEELVISQTINEIALPKKLMRYSEIIYLMTLFLDGKEINDLVTTLINKYDNIFSLLKVMKKEGLKTDFTDAYMFFNYDNFIGWHSDNNEKCRVLEELRIVNSISRMSVSKRALKTSKVKRAMFEDAMTLLGLDNLSPESFCEYISRFMNEKSKIQADDLRFRNFISNNVINSRMFRYIVRYMNPYDARFILENPSIIKYVLKRIEKDKKQQIERYYYACNETVEGEKISSEDMISTLVREITSIHPDKFIAVDQSVDIYSTDYKNKKEENNAKEKRNAIIILTLYLNVIYQVVKNLIYVNSRYVIAFHHAERDCSLLLNNYNENLNEVKDNSKNNKKKKSKVTVSADNLNLTVWTRKMLEDQRVTCEEAAGNWKDISMRYYKKKALSRKLRVIKYCEQNLKNSDELMIQEFRNCVAHNNALKNLHLFIKNCSRFESYFEIYHYLIQNCILASYSYSKNEGEIVTDENGNENYETKDGELIPISPKSIEFLQKVRCYNETYCKDFVKALCAPFMYNLPRFKNLTIDALFDRNDTRKETKKQVRLSFEGENND